jgi:hypothetical protein
MIEKLQAFQTLAEHAQLFVDPTPARATRRSRWHSTAPA